MSGFSDGTNCPNCGGNADLYSDSKPFDYISISCLECGLIIDPKVSYLTLEDLNDAREGLGLEPLIELPEQDEDLI